MKIFKQLSLLLCILVMPMLQANAAEAAVAEEPVAVPKAYTADFEYVSSSLQKVDSAESVLATAAAIKGIGETRGWFIGIAETHHEAEHSSIPWWVLLSLAALILAPLEERISRSTRRFLVAIQN